MFAIFLLFLILVISIIGFVVYRYNHAQRLAQLVREAHSNVLVAMKKRVDLINKLIDIARSYGEHEKLTYIAVVEGENTLSRLAAVNNSAEKMITQLNTISRNYPQLRANETYQSLMNDLNRMEDFIQGRRERYNETVRNYNTLCNEFPFLLVSNSLGLKPAAYFDVESADELSNMKDFVTDDGAILREKFSQFGSKVADTTRIVGGEIGRNGQILLNKTKAELAKRKTTSSGTEAALPDDETPKT